uniref:Sushi domain-containing protein n=1 Tax=Sinocyclocheilus anshuiensis TaxID=1608454 RepID=A0A671M820_9TELE
MYRTPFLYFAWGPQITKSTLVIQTSFASRNVILTCVIGHKPVDLKAFKSVTCQGNQWTNLELNCARQSCGSLADFLYGRYEMTGNLFGDTAKPVCDKGYMLAEQETTRTCQDLGWDGKDPVCEPVKCSSPPVIENGQLEDEPLESYDYSQAVSYRCNKGLNLIGQSTLHCSEDGTFKPDPPKCFGKLWFKCQSRDERKKITWEIEWSRSCTNNKNDDDQNSTASDYCKAYVLFISTAQCTQPSFTSRNVILTAEHLSTPSFPDGSTVTFECVIGHKPVDLKASKSVTCQGNQWTNLELSCTSMYCR